MEEFRILIEQAVDSINSSRFIEAEQYIKEAMVLDMTAAQPHNLFGILLEYQGDRLRAMKHYRAATDLDPTYMPAKHNLFRIGQLTQDANDRIDFGKSPKPDHPNK
jgi:Flp pilus assembly protein TadD